MAADQWPRVKEVFHGALERPSAARPAYLAQACGPDTALRAEVERLLIAHDEMSDFIEMTAGALTGRRIGRYEVGRRIGAGGMGEVWVARDTDLARDVALKIGISEDAIPRLRREAQSAARLNHPHICTIYEVGIWEGQGYIVMEYVDGQTLADLIPREGLPIDAVVRYGGQIADALDHAHQHGVIHRDLKGQNVVITRDGRAKVLDFGLARRLADDSGAQSAESQEQVTAQGMLAGTLSCLAPEVLRGAAADARSDIWAFGVLLYRMASGTQPFSGGTAFELSGAILHQPPAPLPPRVPLPLQEIIGRCLEKSPDARYQRAADIRTALETDLNILPASRTDQARARPTIAVLPFDTLTGGPDTAWLSKGVQTMLMTGLAQGRGLGLVSLQRLHEVVGKSDSPASSRGGAEASDVARHAGASISVAGSIVRVGPALRIDAHIDDLASGRVLTATSVSGPDLFTLVDQLAARIRESVGDRDVADVRAVTDVSSASLEAHRLFAEGMDAFANVRLQAAKVSLEQAVATDPTFADAYLQLALLSGPAGRPADRSAYLTKAAEYRHRLSERRRLLMEVELARDRGRFAEAARSLQHLVAIFPDLDGIATLAVQLHTDVVAPLPDVETMLATAKAVVAANPSSTVARNVYGFALIRAGRFDEGIRELEVHARLAPREANPYDSLGEAYLMMGSPDKALEAYSRARTIDPTFVTGGRAWVLAVLGRYDEAMRESGFPPHLTAVMLARLGRYAEAEQTIAAAIQAAEAGGNFAAAAGLHLLASLLAIERTDHACAIDRTRLAEDALRYLPVERQRLSRALVSVVGGIAEVRLGRLDAARSHLESHRRMDEAASTGVAWLNHILEGEILLAAGDLPAAATAFSRGQPVRRTFYPALVEGSVLVNDLRFRDGLARVARAHGDLRGALDAYRQLLACSHDQAWVAAFDPFYLLERARLFEQMADHPAARAEYERLLGYWGHADADLPELAEARRAMARLL